jgi:hypothetical protein
MSPDMRRDPRYGTNHDAQRAHFAKLIKRGHILQCQCIRPDCNHIGQCPTMIGLGSLWDLGHNDSGYGYNGPECRGCNRSAGARKAQGRLYTEPPDRW